MVYSYFRNDRWFFVGTYFYIININFLIIKFLHHIGKTLSIKFFRIFTPLYQGSPLRAIFYALQLVAACNFLLQPNNLNTSDSFGLILLSSHSTLLFVPNISWITSTHFPILTSYSLAILTTSPFKVAHSAIFINP